jgi:ankyrin repeat protein
MCGRASPNISDVHGKTLVMVAARTGHVDVFRILVEAGADDSSTDDEGWSAMEKAKARRHGPAVETIYKFRFSET